MTSPDDNPEPSPTCKTCENPVLLCDCPGEHPELTIVEVERGRLAAVLVEDE